MVAQPQADQYDAAILCVAHDQFKQLGRSGIAHFLHEEHVLFDVKHLLPADEVDGRL
jgi:UDP-N-acetyl-D-galactosamine dehydrogenase